MRLAVGVLGQADMLAYADQALREDIELKVFQLGMTIALKGCALVASTCPGLPYAAVHGARVAGGQVIGISPGFVRGECASDHGSPVQEFDSVIYAGPRLMGRAAAKARASDVMIVVGDRVRTLSQFAVAYGTGKPVGVLRGTGGIADAIDALMGPCDNRTEGGVLFDDDPVCLVGRLLERYKIVREQSWRDACHPSRSYPGQAARISSILSEASQLWPVGAAKGPAALGSPASDRLANRAGKAPARL